MRIIQVLVLTIILGASSYTYADKVEGARGTAYGADHAFSLKAPAGWIVDTESGAQARIGLVFYPVGKTWSNSDAVMYARASPKDIKIQTIDQQVKLTLMDLQLHGSPNSKAEPVADRRISDNRIARIVFYSGDQWGNFEAVGYIDELKTINFLVLNARNRAAFETALPFFYDIIESYKSSSMTSVLLR